MTLIFAVLAVAFLVAVLIGCSMTERAFEARSMRQAAMQQALNSQWQELEAAQREQLVGVGRRQALRIGGDLPGCQGDPAESSRMLAVKTPVLSAQVASVVHRRQSHHHTATARTRAFRPRCAHGYLAVGGVRRRQLLA